MALNVFCILPLHIGFVIGANTPLEARWSPDNTKKAALKKLFNILGENKTDFLSFQKVGVYIAVGIMYLHQSKSTVFILTVIYEGNDPTSDPTAVPTLTAGLPCQSSHTH